MSEEERSESKILVYQILPSRYGFDPGHLRACEAIEIVVGQGAKPGGGGMLLGQKITERVAEMRTLPPGIDQRSACRHPDWTGPDDLTIKIQELRELTNWEKPVFVKIGASRPRIIPKIEEILFRDCSKQMCVEITPFPVAYYRPRGTYILLLLDQRLHIRRIKEKVRCDNDAAQDIFLFYNGVLSYLSRILRIDATVNLEEVTPCSVWELMLSAVPRLSGPCAGI
jgi:hypothetical protein